MPEYLSPGVYVEEVSYRAKSIEGVSTTTTGFIGPARYGPIDLQPDVITSLGDFEAVYGDRNQLQFRDATSGQEETLHNYLWHAVRAFFVEGGKRLYVSRAFKPLVGEYPPADFETVGQTGDGQYEDGHARNTVPASGGANAIRIRARFPGSAGHLRVRFTFRLGQNALGQDGMGASAEPSLKGVRENDVVWIRDVTSPIESPPGTGAFFLAEPYFNTTTKENTWRFKDAGGTTIELAALTPNPNPDRSDTVRVLTVAISLVAADGQGLPQVWSGLALDPHHQKNGAADSLTAFFAEEQASLASARTLPIVLSAQPAQDGLDILEQLLTDSPKVRDALDNPNSTDLERSVEVILEGGNDGQRPGADEYEGKADPNSTKKTGLVVFEDIEDISIVAAPGSTYGYQNGYRDDGATIINLLLAHAEKMRYRIAVLDSGDGQSIADVREMRGRIDSTYGAFYYPWVRVLDPLTRAEIFLPPSGFMAGIYARNDINRAVYKAPANEVVNLALGFEQLLNKSQQDVLNPEGINCFRYFEGRGFRIWGGRTTSSDPEWKYINLRRYFAYVEHSIDKGTQWAVFEPNGELLWANVRRTIQDFLLNEWQMGALLGDKPEKAFFVRCDRSTMTQNDLDNGRLVCLIGIAPLRPAEFVIFRIGQWTGDRKG